MVWDNLNSNEKASVPMSSFLKWMASLWIKIVSIPSYGDLSKQHSSLSRLTSHSQYEVKIAKGTTFS